MPLANHTWQCPWNSVVPEATHEASRGPPIPSRFLDRDEGVAGRNSVSLTRGQIFAPKANQWFFLQKGEGKNWVSVQTWERQYLHSSIHKEWTSFFFRGNAEVRQSLHQAKVRLKQSKRKDYYKILGVERGANDDEIKKAYKKRALATHPGRNHWTSQIHSRTVKTTLEPSGTVPFFCHSFCNQTLHIKKSKS